MGIISSDKLGDVYDYVVGRETSDHLFNVSILLIPVEI